MYENKSHRNKKIALAAALAVAILALAGVGYAAVHTYTGTTTSSTQDVDVDYVVVTLTDGNGYTGYSPATKIHGVFTSTNTTAVGTTTYTSFVSDVIKYEITVEFSTDVGLWTGAANDVITVTATGGACDNDAFVTTFCATEDGEYSTSIPSSLTIDNNNKAHLYVKIAPAAEGTSFLNTYKVDSVQIGTITFTASAQEADD